MYLLLYLLWAILLNSVCLLWEHISAMEVSDCMRHPLPCDLTVWWSAKLYYGPGFVMACCLPDVCEWLKWLVYRMVHARKVRPLLFLFSFRTTQDNCCISSANQQPSCNTIALCTVINSPHCSTIAQSSISGFRGAACSESAGIFS